MGEGEGGRIRAPALRLGDQLCAGGILERADERFFVHVARAAQRFEIKFAPQNRRIAQHLLGRPRKLQHTRLDRRAHRLRNFDLLHGRAVPAPIAIRELACVDQRLANFFNEKRVALRLAVNAVQKVGRNVFGEHGDEQVARLIAAEARQVQLHRQALTVQLHQHVGQSARQLKFRRAKRHHDEQRQFTPATGKVLQQEKCAAIGPMRVIHKQHQWRLRAHRCAPCQDALEHALLFRARVERGVGADIREAHA